MVPLVFLLSNRGRGFSPCTEDEDEDEVDVAAGEADERVGFVVVGSATAGMALDAGDVIFGLAVCGAAYQVMSIGDGVEEA